MEYRRFGRTGLRVSVVGLGAGGPSQLGARTGRSRQESVALVRRALDLGITYVDTAESYGTEEIIGEAVRGRARSEVVLSSKKGAFRNGAPVSAQEFTAGVEGSLQRLGVETIDVFHVHGPGPGEYGHVRDELAPAMMKLREAGKIRYLAISERPPADGDHLVLQQAIADDLFDVVMVAFNILKQTARGAVLPATREKGIATECMFAVRRAFSRPARLREIAAELVACGELEADALSPDDPLGWVLEESDASTVPEAAYRFCRHEPGIDVVLTGTGNVEHLEENVASLLKPPLPVSVSRRLRRTFSGVRSATGG